MSACVIDTSAIIAYLNEEPGAVIAEEWLDKGAAVSTLCVQEAITILVRRGVDRDAAAEVMTALGVKAYPLDFDLAVDGGALITQTQSKGLSHGDRACLALARKLKLPTVTTDRIWSEIADEVGVKVVLIR
ncbi:type II toxin-antitoxin system VapC family toxin [Rhizobium sp. CFBP 8762]|uniref:PIN domain-containing protein n=1 Tax=Rhizobium sp. CFBP 8762 TaxID=2775279 RepID=UPI00177FE9F7|nr:type II toxin-antitoxin system VapC family toxin [Rhizobium sp. CFBP 8762]MBD8555137.1 type II toxin-antitoxin system VapC family toxin [Rhizobium sp. CFBP 8762]